jgi:hypothetical protein
MGEPTEPTQPAGEEPQRIRITTNGSTAPLFSEVLAILRVSSRRTSPADGRPTPPAP